MKTRIDLSPAEKSAFEKLNVAEREQLLERIVLALRGEIARMLALSKVPPPPHARRTTPPPIPPLPPPRAPSAPQLPAMHRIFQKT